jgi:hypothetical protein
MESGDDELLRFLQKPGCAADVLEAVTRLKQAGCAVSVIVMIGIGGDHFAERHVAATIAALNAMPLGTGDIIYFSPFIDQMGSEYGRSTELARIGPLNEVQMAQQEAAIRAGLRPADAKRPPKCSRYDIREFVY